MFPDQDAVDEAEEAVEDNLFVIKPESIVAAEPDDISTTSTKQLVENGSVSKRTSFSLEINKQVEKGGAVLLTNIELPIKSHTFDNTPLPEPKIAANGLPSNYSVYKTFENAGTINLMREFGTELFEYDEGDKAVRMKAALVVIDGPYKNADGEEPGVVPVVKGNNYYGVKLSGDKKYLYVYDGDPDESAIDPLWIGADDGADDGVDDGAAGSAGGCDAGLGAGAILALAGFVLLGMKKRV
jgi:hypothetical protein